MVPLCPILHSDEWARFPERLEMSYRPQGHAGQRLSLTILLFTWGCAFICVLHSTGQREQASLQFSHVKAACFGIFTWLCSPCEKAQLLMWGIAAKHEKFLYHFFNQFSCSKESDFFLLFFLFFFSLSIWALLIFLLNFFFLLSFTVIIPNKSL